ncbi:uncharacterized protein [Salminus brasiliensis]|uniref:uncharacterized protein n=1 Tax=Salminus brasiliensis TaxID=930266 RepID=UPI003B836092
MKHCIIKLLSSFYFKYVSLSTEHSFCETVYVSLFTAVQVTEPTITLLAAEDDNKVKLVCLLDSFFPEEQFEVKWLEGKSPFKGSPITKPLENKINKGEKLFTQISEIYINVSQLNEDSEYTCQAAKNINSTWNKCKAHPLLKPLIYLKKPRLVSAKTGSEEVTASCVVEAAPNSRVSWVLNEKQRDGTHTAVDNPGNKTQLITSTLTLSVTEWEKEKTLVCRVKQPCSKEHEEAVSVLEPVEKTPTVEIRRSIADVLKGVSAVLECSARDLPSGEFSVAFQANGHQIHEEYVEVPKSQSTVTTRVNIPTIYQTKDYNFTCEVQQSPSNKWQSDSTGHIFGEPSVELLMVPNIEKAKSQILLCYGTGFYPKITWNPTSVQMSSNTMMQADGRVTVSSQIRVEWHQWSKGVEYICQVNDPVTTAKKSISVCTATESVKPLINLEKPRLASAKAASENITASCIVKAALNSNISWVSNGNKQIAVTPVEESSSKTQLVNSTLTLSAVEWEKKQRVTCRVQQPCGMGHEETVNVLEPVLKKPTVEIRWLVSEISNGAANVLECSARDLPSGELSVIFQANKDQFLKASYVDLPKGQSTLATRFSIPVEYQKKGFNFSCKVQQSPSKRWISESTGYIFDPKCPAVQIFKPSDIDLPGSHDSTLLCLITGFNPADISVHWELNKMKLDASIWINSPVESYSDGQGFFMHSIITLPAPRKEHDTFSCVVNHQSSQSPIVRLVDNIYASATNSTPSVKVMQARDELICLAYNYSPSPISIIWLLDDMKVQHEDSLSPAKGPDGKFTVKSQLNVVASKWAPGSTYTCLVQHITGNTNQSISKAEIIEQNLYFDENTSNAIAEDTAEETWNMACAFLALFLLSLIYGCSVTLVKVKTA